MKTLLKFALVIFCVFTFFQANSQVLFGPKVGLNLSTLTMKSSGMSIDPKTMTGFNVGLVCEIPIKANFFLQPGFIYSTKGSKYTVSGETMSISPTFIEIPVNGLVKFGAGSAKFLIFAGPYFAYGIGGSYKTPTESADINYGSGSNHDMKPFDIGLNIGAGVEINHFMITVQYGFGLANLAPVTDNDTEMKLGVIGISMAYMFGAK